MKTLQEILAFDTYSYSMHSNNNNDRNKTKQAIFSLAIET